MISAELFDRLFPSKGLNPRKYNHIAKRSELLDSLNKFLPAYEINTHKRVSAFLSCCGVETDYFKTTEEYASGADYEGRKDLGNTQKGDGRRFKGRGIIQTTGRGNYTELQETVGVALGLDFVKDPALLNVVEVAVESACFYWRARDLNKYADAKKIKNLNAKVNRGRTHDSKGNELAPLHWAKRNELYSKCWRLIPTDFTFEEAENADPELTEFTEGVRPIELSPETEMKFSQAADLAKGPTFKTVAKKVASRVITPLGLLWGTTSGKIVLILTALIIVGGIGYTIYLYRKQVQLGWQIAVATIKKKAGLS
jgi:predicted chitinase